MLISTIWLRWYLSVFFTVKLPFFTSHFLKGSHYAMPPIKKWGVVLCLHPAFFFKLEIFGILEQLSILVSYLLLFTGSS